MPRFVLEIGTEEIPPRFFPPALAQLREDGSRLFEQARLTVGDVEVYGTPRRLVLIAEGLAEKQTAATREERGPAARVAFDEEGDPTKAAHGFARRYGLTPGDLEVRDTDQGEYVFAVIREPELPAKDALAPLLPDLIRGLSFPKSMRWGTGKLRFARPIRWLLALVDAEVVEFELDGIHSGRLTRGHPVLADEMMSVERAQDYEDVLKGHFVLMDEDERRGHIAEVLDRISAQHGAIPLATGTEPRIAVRVLKEDVEHFQQQVVTNLEVEATYLVEWPTVGCGSFDRQFLDLPDEVLIEEMQHVQSYFPLRDPERKRLLPRFVGVRDGGEDHLDAVIRGWESVLRAKLIDAQFFYDEDRKRRLEDRVEDLKGVIFGEKLGTMHDKVERVREVASAALHDVFLTAQSPPVPDVLDRAALLCKADLTTQVVTELPALQGRMGGGYAREDGEPHAASVAIAEHYQPRFAGDAIPGGTTGLLLAAADKVDTVTAHFAVGHVPTGSADPYALRREASGVVRIITEGRLSLRVSRLIDRSLEALSRQGYGERPRDEVRTDVLDFLRQRLATQLREQDVRYDLVDAALAPGVDDLLAAKERAEALQRVSKERDDFLPTVIACTRPMNIARDFEGGEVDPSLFQDDAERVLWDAYTRVAEKADDVNLAELFDLIASELRERIDRYFDDVLVMTEDEKLRHNRLAMCWQLRQLFQRIADFSLVVQV